MQVFFIVGRGRSGTTLLSRMLSKHAQLVVAPEGFFIANLYQRYRAGPWDRRRIDAFCRDLVRENRMRTWQLDAERLARRLAAKPGLSYADVCREIYLSYAEDTLGRLAPRWVGDKNPHYSLLLDRLDRVFPDARYVHVVRDYRDNVCSFRQVPFDMNDPVALAARWRSYNLAILRRSCAAPHRFMRLRFEDLVQNPAHELSRVCEFFELEYDPQMLAFQDADDRAFYGKNSPWFEDLRKPLDATRSGRWQGHLPREVERQVDAICGELGRHFGYLPSTSSSLGLRGHLTHAIGCSTVLAERLVFGALPAQLRIELINGYRRLSGRV